jgi:putative glutamine amidotransferase
MLREAMTSARDRSTDAGSRSHVAAGGALPFVVVPACNRNLGELCYHVAASKYVDAVRLAGCQPLIVPSVAPPDVDALLDVAHGMLLTGSPSNVHPQHYDETVLDESLPLDPARDAWILPIIPKVLARGVPLFAICRGFQEANVALGGTLHQAVHQVQGLADHRDRDEDPVDVQYQVAHEVFVEPGGLLARLLETDRIAVNSLHGQGVKRLAPRLRIEARAPDGLVEAFSIPDAPGFALAVQWHPEWHAAENPVSMRLLGAFGDAVRAYQQARRSEGVRAKERHATA